MASTYERRAQLLETLNDHGRITIGSAAETLGVSVATVRRDLDQLARRHLLTRTRGGALPSHVAHDLPLSPLPGRGSDEALRIARAAAGLVPSGAVVGLNGGTIASYVARELGARVDRQDQGGRAALTVVTNAANIGVELAMRAQVKTVMTGGVARPHSYELTGRLATVVLQGIALDMAILDVNAVSPVSGATGHDEAEADIGRAMAERADRLIVVADSAKVGSRAFAQVCAVRAIDVLVTGGEVPEGLVRQFTSQGVRVVSA